MLICIDLFYYLISIFSVILKDTLCLYFILGVLAKLFHQTNLLIEKMNVIEKKINLMPGIVDNAILDNDETSAIIKNFPMRSMKLMEEFENILHKEYNYKHMVSLLRNSLFFYLIYTNRPVWHYSDRIYNLINFHLYDPYIFFKLSNIYQ